MSTAIASQFEPEGFEHVADEQSGCGHRDRQRPSAGEISETPRFCLAVVSSEGAVPTPLIDWIGSSRAFESASYMMVKRFLDIVGASLGLLVLGPFALVGMLLTWLEDGGPVIFSQKRVGLNGDTFKMFKIRTMVKDAEKRLAEVAALNQHADPRTFKVKDDPRLLRVGKWLRRFSIDEFPQLVNVLRGDMTLVGPRPPLPHEVEQYDAEDHVRLTVRPGLTCYWQVYGRGEIPFKEHVELDRQYIQDCSTWTDLVLIAKTLPALLRGRGAC